MVVLEMVGLRVPQLTSDGQARTPLRLKAQYSCTPSRWACTYLW